MKLRVVWFVSTLAVGSLGAQQPVAPATTGTGLVLGRVVDATTARPVRSAIVSIVPVPAAGAAPAPGATTGARVATDAQGRFVLSQLPKGAFTLTATKPGYVPGAYGKRTPSGANQGQPLDLADGERRGDITLTVWKYAVASGTVLDEAGEPMQGVQVRVLRRTLSAGRWQLSQTGNQPSTDDRGMFRISSLAPGQYVFGVVSSIAATPVALYDSYVESVQSGSSTAFSRTLDPGASVSSAPALRRGAFVLAPGSPGLGSGPSDSALLRPNEAGPLFVYPTVFYPTASTVTLADTITLAPGEERSNIDFRLRPSPSFLVSGTLTGPEGAVSGTALQLLPSGVEMIAREYGFEAASTVTSANGAFTFFGVTPGQYVIRAFRVPQRPTTLPGTTTVVQVGGSTITSFTSSGIQPPIPDEPTWWAVQPVSVGANDVTGVSVALRNGAHVGGRVEFTGAAPQPAADRLAQLRVSIDSADGRAAGSTAATLATTGQVDAQGQLHSYQLPAGRYLIRTAAAPPGWTFAGAWLDGKDVSTTAFELGGADITNLIVRFTDRPAQLSGTVRDDARAPDGKATVLLFPADTRLWTDYGSTSRRFRSAATSSAGVYTLTAVADGEYLIAAVHELPDDWQDPTVLKRLAPLATTVVIAEGEKKTQDLRVSVPR